MKLAITSKKGGVTKSTLNPKKLLKDSFLNDSKTKPLLSL